MNVILQFKNVNDQIIFSHYILFDTQLPKIVDTVIISGYFISLRFATIFIIISTFAMTFKTIIKLSI